MNFQPWLVLAGGVEEGQQARLVAGQVERVEGEVFGRIREAVRVAGKIVGAHGDPHPGQPQPVGPERLGEEAFALGFGQRVQGVPTQFAQGPAQAGPGLIRLIGADLDTQLIVVLQRLIALVGPAGGADGVAGYRGWKNGVAGHGKVRVRGAAGHRIGHEPREGNPCGRAVGAGDRWSEEVLCSCGGLLNNEARRWARSRPSRFQGSCREWHGLCN